jgi:hypothetical protein
MRSPTAEQQPNLALFFSIVAVLNRGKDFKKWQMMRNNNSNLLFPRWG